MDIPPIQARDATGKFIQHPVDEPPHQFGEHLVLGRHLFLLESPVAVIEGAEEGRQGDATQSDSQASTISRQRYTL
jgi:hypothetical protein